jgi:hypothetical protein
MFENSGHLFHHNDDRMTTSPMFLALYPGSIYLKVLMRSTKPEHVFRLANHA